MNVIRISCANNQPNLFYRVMPELSHLRIPAKYDLQAGTADIKPYSDKTIKALKKALNELKVKFTEVEE